MAVTTRHVRDRRHAGPDRAGRAGRVPDAAQRAEVEATLTEGGRELIPITHQQMAEYAGNMLELLSEDGTHLIAMSRRAHASLDPEQLAALGRHGQLLPVDIDTIESTTQRA